MESVVIIGSGPAGLTAAIYAARAGLNPVLYSGIMHGGQLTTTTEVENFPGFKDPVMGGELMTSMSAQAERVGTRIVHDSVTRVDFSDRTLRLWLGATEVRTKAVIIATGATAKTLGLPREAELMGRGLSTCATCDGFFFRGKRVAVAGGGDSAMEEASYLAKLCSEVLLIHRRAKFRASNIMLERVMKNPKIKVMTPWIVSEPIADSSGVTAIRLKHVDTGETRDEQVESLFMAIGHTPNSELFAPFLDTDANGYILTKNYTETKVPGVYAAGDIADSTFRQAVTAAGLGCQAAMQAARYLETMEGH